MYMYVPDHSGSLPALRLRCVAAATTHCDWQADLAAAAAVAAAVENLAKPLAPQEDTAGEE